MKTAEEMFKELGYKQTIYKDTIAYELLIAGKFGDEWKQIVFNLDIKTFYADENYESMYINIQTFKAIHQQLKELGWLDE